MQSPATAARKKPCAAYDTLPAAPGNIALTVPAKFGPDNRDFMSTRPRTCTPRCRALATSAASKRNRAGFHSAAECLQRALPLQPALALAGARLQFALAS